MSLRMFGSDRKSDTPPSHGKEGPGAMAVQVALIRVGIPVRLTGVMDAKTRGGIRLFQRSNGLGETGYLDKETVELLKAMVKSRSRVIGRKRPGTGSSGVQTPESGDH